MRRRHDRSGLLESSHGIDPAPMLDFVVNLLMFFIITAVFLRQPGVTVNRPTGTEPVKDDAPSIFRILDDGEILADRRPVDIRAVRAHAERIRAVRPDGAVLILAELGASTGTLVAVVDQVHLGGIDEVTFSTSF